METPPTLSKPISLKLAISLLLFIVVLLGGAGIYFYLYPKWRGSSTETPTVKLSCPVPEELCSSAKALTGWDGAFGFKLEEGTEIRIPISGFLTLSTLMAPEEAYLVGVTTVPGDKNAFSVGLIFKGDLSSFGRGQVVKGYLIGRSGDPLEAYEGVNLVVQVYDGGAPVPHPLQYLEVAR